MSQVREGLNPGLLEGDHIGRERHVREQGFSADEVVRKEDGEGRDYEEERGGGQGGGHDSDPPIENQNPEDGDGTFEEVKHFAEDEELEEEEEEESESAGGRKKSQFYHRKRKKSIHNSDGSYVPPYKKNRFRRQVSVLPSKFLLGGNIRDPLNLASLADAKVNAELNKATPTSSPLPVPSHRRGQVPVFIPKNPDDPLGLGVSTENPQDIIAGVRTGKHKKHRHRRRHGRKRTDSECSVNTDTLGDDDGEDASMRRRRACSEMVGVSLESSDEDYCEETVRKTVERAASVPKQKEENKQPNASASIRPVIEAKDVVKTCETQKKDVTTEKLVEEKAPVESKAVSFDKKGKSDNVKEETTCKLEDKPEKKPVVNEDADGKKETLKTSNEIASEEHQQSGVYPCKSSEYVPLSSSYAPSPYIFDTMNSEETFEVKPFESPSLTNYCCSAATPSHLMEPFSPPPRPEIPDFQRRMQMMSAIPIRHPPISLRRAVFQKPFNRRRFRHKSDPIVSPVIPQPGCGGRRNHHHHHHSHHHNHRPNRRNNEKQGTLNTSNASSSSCQSLCKKGNTVKAKNNDAHKNEIKNFRPKDEIYQFGNYKQYYGYRTTPDGEDPRLWVMKKEWFREKDVLDIGCNIGHVTLSIARDFEARRVHGIDIDNNLITTARKNIKHYMIHDPSDKNIVFPHSLPMIFGAMQPPSGVGSAPQKFPFNVMFSQENYVMSNDSLLNNVKPEYDVIICLSVTKWIHLNFGDDGMKRFFRRIFRHLRKGGKLILEPQEWSSYCRKRKLTAKISENYRNIKFLPDQFQDYLVNEVGFKFVQRLGTPHHSKGFQRPILVFCKESTGGATPQTCDQNHASDNIETKADVN